MANGGGRSQDSINKDYSLRSSTRTLRSKASNSTLKSSVNQPTNNSNCLDSQSKHNSNTTNTSLTSRTRFGFAPASNKELQTQNSVSEQPDSSKKDSKIAKPSRILSGSISQTFKAPVAIGRPASSLGHRSSNTSQSGTINSRIPLAPSTQRQRSSSINLSFTPSFNQATSQNGDQSIRDSVCNLLPTPTVETSRQPRMLQLEHDKLLSQISEKETQFKSLKEIYEQRAVELSNQIERIESESEQKIKELRSELSNAQSSEELVEQLKQVNTRYESQISGMTSQIQSLQREIEDMDREHGNIASQIMKLEDEKVELKAQLEKTESELMTARKIQEQSPSQKITLDVKSSSDHGNLSLRDSMPLETLVSQLKDRINELEEKSGLQEDELLTLRSKLLLKDHKKSSTMDVQKHKKDRKNGETEEEGLLEESIKQNGEIFFQNPNFDSSALMMLDDRLEIEAGDDLRNVTYNEVADATVGFNIFDDSNFFKSNVNQSVLQGTCENTPRAKNGVAENSFHLSTVGENDVNASKYLAVPTDPCLRSVETQTDKESRYAELESLVIDLQSKLSASEAYLIDQRLSNDQSSRADHDMKNDSLILEESTRCSTNGKDGVTETVGSDEDSALVSIDEKIKTRVEDLNSEIERLKNSLIPPDLYQATLARLEACEAELDEAKRSLYSFQDTFENMNKLQHDQLIKNDTKLRALEEIHSNKEATLAFQYEQRIQELNSEVQRTKSELETIKNADPMDDFDPERLAVLTRRLRQERDEGQRIIQFLSVERQAMEEGNRKVVAKIKSEHQQSKDQAKEVLQSLVLAISVLYKSTRSVKTRSTLKSSLLISQKVQEPIKLEFEVSSSLSVDGANTSSIEDSQKECMSDVEMRNMPSDEEEMSSIFLVNEESLVKKTAEDLNQTPAVIHSLTHCSPSKFEQVEFPFAEISAFMDDTLESRLENCIKNSALDDQQQIDTKSTVAEIETLREQVSSLKAQLDLKECEVEFSDTKLKNLNQQLSELDSMAKNLAHEQIPGLRNEVKGLRVELEQEKDLSKHLEDQLKAVVSQKEIHLETISRLQADLDSKELYLSDRVEELEKTIEGHLSTIVKMNETQIAVESKKDLSERKCFELLKRVFEVDLRKDEGDSIAEQSGQWGIEASKCQNHTSEFEGKVVIAIKRLAELEAQLEGFEKLLKDSSEKAMRFSDEKQTVVNQLQDSEKVNEQLREEVDRLTTCCKQNTVDTVDSEEAERQRQDLEKRLGEVVRLSAERQSDLDRLTLEAERQRQDLEKRLEEVCEEVVRLSAERQFDLERLTLEAQTQRQVMEKRAEELSEEVLRLSAEKQAVLDQFQGSEKVVEQLNEEVSRLSAEKQATVDSFQSEIKSQQTSKERILAEIEEARSNSRIALASLASIESELVASKEEINQLKVELKSSNLQLESIQDKSKAYDTLVEEIKLERLSNVKVLKELEEARSSYKDAIAHNEVTIARLIDAEEESKKLRAALESVKSKVSSMEDMSKAYEALVISFESVQAEAESLKNQVEMLCEGSRTDSVRIEKLVAEIEEREELVNSLKADLMTFSKLQRNTSSPTMNNRISELETIVGLKTSEADEAMDRLLEEMRKNKKLTNLVENLRMSIKSSEKQLTKLEAQPHSTLTKDSSLKLLEEPENSSSTTSSRKRKLDNPPTPREGRTRMRLISPIKKRENGVLDELKSTQNTVRSSDSLSSSTRSNKSLKTQNTCPLKTSQRRRSQNLDVSSSGRIRVKSGVSPLKAKENETFDNSDGPKLIDHKKVDQRLDVGCTDSSRNHQPTNRLEVIVPLQSLSTNRDHTNKGDRSNINDKEVDNHKDLTVKPTQDSKSKSKTNSKLLASIQSLSRKQQASKNVNNSIRERPRRKSQLENRS